MSVFNCGGDRATTWLGVTLLRQEHGGAAPVRSEIVNDKRLITCRHW